MMIFRAPKIKNPQLAANGLGVESFGNVINYYRIVRDLLHYINPPAGPATG